METRRIGSLKVSIVGLGCSNFGWRLDAKGSEAVVHAALDAGITFFDSADVYGDTHSEEFLGKALGRRRGEAIVATKFGSPIDEKRKGARPEYVKRAVEDSLRRLGTEVIDLYQLHQVDPLVPIGDTLGALSDLVKAGKVREIGCSNLTPGQLKAAEAATRKDGAHFVSVQGEYSLLHREAEQGLIPECRRQGLAFLPFFPLASGLLSGKYRYGQPAPQGSRIGSGGMFSDLMSERNLRVVEDLMLFASSRGRTLLELALSWLAARPSVASVMAGATSVEQARANAAAAGWHLTDADMGEVNTIAKAE